MEYSYYAVFEYSSNEEINKGIAAIGIYFPDFIGCVSCGKTKQHGIEMAKDSLSLHIAAELADKKTLPHPSVEKDLQKDLLPNEKLFRITIEL